MNPGEQKSLPFWGLQSLKSEAYSAYMVSPWDWELLLINKEGISKFFKAVEI